MISKSKIAIFKRGSVTYYTASLFFPPHIKKDIFTLYAFVRIPDDFVDSVPQQKAEFLAFKKETFTHLAGKPTDNPIIRDFVKLANEKKFEQSWIEAFMHSMEMDLSKKVYKTIAELEEYMYGSAEVIGLFIARILDLPKDAYPSAQKLGKAMQLINFIRDVREDIDLGRTYLPAEDMKQFGVAKLSPQEPGIKELIRFEIRRWREMQKEAEKGYSYIPRSSLLPIKTASDMYSWTATQIEQNPLIIFEKKVKPRPARIILTYWKNVFTL